MFFGEICPAVVSERDEQKFFEFVQEGGWFKACVAFYIARK